MSMLLAAVLVQATVATSPQTPGGPPTAAGAPGPATPATHPAGTKVAGKDRNKMVCKDYMPLGSRIPGPKLCRTVAEWDAQRSEARSQMEKNQSLKDIGHDF